MKFAVFNNSKIETSKGAKGYCPSCGSELIAKCGNVKINHWAHKGNRNCDL
jgi:competence CoiA-like predicted nuclease